jgi:hypothetical protein
VIAAMGKDPLFQQSERESGRLAADGRVMRFASVIMILKLLTGLAALALIGAIWLVWRAG